MSLIDKVNSGKFIVLGEFEPPKGIDFSRMLANANQVKGRIDGFIIPEMANAVMKASSLGGSIFLQMQGFETVMQICCRDRNRLALQADILAASAMGTSNLMVVSGENITFGDHPTAKTVFDIDIFELLEVLKNLHAGKDMAGIEIAGKPQFFIGSSFNAGARGEVLDMEIEHLTGMTDLGVKFIITTPVFDLKSFQNVLDRIDTEQVTVIPTVLLLKSAGMARYIDRNMDNISIPAEMISSIQKAPDKPRRCIQLAAELIREIKNMGMAGVMISTVGWEDKLPQILDEARL
jgi:5,10-methylenetetrahydrofolate reductase